MKFATLENGTRDGQLVLVSRDLTHALPVPDLAPTLLHALENWDTLAPHLESRYAALNEKTIPKALPFDPAHAMAPLPRAPQWLDASAFQSHGERMVKAFNLSTNGLNLPFPLMYQGCSDDFLGPHAAMPIVSEEHGIDLEGEIAIITGNVPIGTSAANAEACIRLITIVDDVSLRGLLFREMSLGFGMIQCKPTCVFAPVAVTLDELGTAWRDGRACVTMSVRINGKWQGDVSGDEMGFSFGQLIEHAARTRKLSAGTIIGSGTISNADTARGTTCLSETRALEKIKFGEPRTPWLKFGDRVHMNVRDPSTGASIFGAIDHTFVPAHPAVPEAQP